MTRPMEIIMESKAQESDNPRTNLICRTLDGKFHRVMAITPDMTEVIPAGWEKVNAIKKIIANRELEILLQVE